MQRWLALILFAASAAGITGCTALLAGAAGGGAGYYVGKESGDGEADSEETVDKDEARRE